MLWVIGWDVTSSKALVFYAGRFLLMCDNIIVYIFNRFQ